MISAGAFNTGWRIVACLGSLLSLIIILTLYRGRSEASEAVLVQEVQTVRTSHASLDCELGTAKAIIAHAQAIEEDLRQALLAAEATGSATAQVACP